MFTNRISRYFEADQAQQLVRVNSRSFVVCPMNLMPGEWARPIYEAAWNQAQAQVHQRHKVAMHVSWN